MSRCLDRWAICWIPLPWLTESHVSEASSFIIAIKVVRSQVRMTKRIFLSLVALLAILVCISSALESQNDGLIQSNDLLIREARDADPDRKRKADLNRKRKTDLNRKRKADLNRKRCFVKYRPVEGWMRCKSDMVHLYRLYCALH